MLTHLVTHESTDFSQGVTAQHVQQHVPVVAVITTVVPTF